MSARSERPLSIAMLIETVLLGGAEMVVFQLAEALRERGHLVHPVVPAEREGWLLDQFSRSGFRWHTYLTRPGLDWRLPRELAALLEPLAVDVVHSHEFYMSVYGTAAARRLKRPHVITMHGNQVMTARFRRRVALRWAFRRSHATVAVSEDTRRQLEKDLGLRPGVVQVVPNGIPVRRGNRDRIRGEFNVGADDLLLVAVGNLIPRKGHAVLLEALARLGRNGRAPKWRLIIAGEGSERPRLEAFARENRLDDRVHLPGHRQDIPDLQAAADIFVMPSLWEGLPLAILEAMFAGTAIVASNISGIPEAIDHDRHGLLIPSGDADALASALWRLMESAADRTRLGQAALARARECFTIDVMTANYERLYRQGRSGT